MILKKEKELKEMSMHKFTIMFPDGARLDRCEWGKSRKDALKTLIGIYGEIGKDFVVVK